MRSVVHVLSNILVVIIVGWDVLVVVNMVSSVDVMAHGVVRSCEIVVVEMSIVMVIMVVMVVVVLNNMILWSVVRIDVGIVMLNSVWVIEVVVSMVSTIGDNMVGVMVNWLMVYWFVMNCNWSMHWSMDISVVWSSMGINMMWSSMSNSMNWNSSMWSIMMWSWVSNNMCGSMNIMDWGVSGVNWGMNIMGSSEMSVDSISVLVVCSMASVVLWVRMMVRITVMREMVGIWVMSIIMARIPIIMVAVVSSIVVLTDVKTMIPMMESMVVIMMVHWLHLENQVTSGCVDIRWVEN